MIDSQGIATTFSIVMESTNQAGQLSELSENDTKTAKRYLLEYFKKYNNALFEELKADEKIKTPRDLFTTAIKHAVAYETAFSTISKYQAMDSNTTKEVTPSKSIPARVCFGCGRSGHDRDECLLKSHPEFNLVGSSYPHNKPLDFKRKLDGTLLDNPIAAPNRTDRGDQRHKKSRHHR